MAKAKQNAPLYEKGQEVRFVGYTAEKDEDLPDNHEALEEGEVYTVARVDEEEGSETFYILTADNPYFDEDEPSSAKSNPKTVEIEVVAGEIEAVEEEEEEEGEEGEEEQEEEEGEEEGSEEETIDIADVVKGMSVSVEVDGEEEYFEGEVTSATKASIKVADSEGNEYTIKKSDVVNVWEIDAEEEGEEEEEEEGEEGYVDPEMKKVIQLTDEEEDADVVALISESEDLIGLAKELSDTAASTEYQLGGVLYHVLKDGLHVEVSEDYRGRGGFAQYVEDNLGFKYRKAMYLIDIYTKFNKFGLTSDNVLEIGWTKASIIAGLMTSKKDAKSLLSKARKNKVDDLRDFSKQAKKTGGNAASNEEVVQRKTFSYRLEMERAEPLESILAQAGEATGIEDDAELFEHIVNEWAGEHLDVSRNRPSARAGNKGGKPSTTKKRSTAKK